MNERFWRQKGLLNRYSRHRGFYLPSHRARLRRDELNRQGAGEQGVKYSKGAKAPVGASPDIVSCKSSLSPVHKGKMNSEIDYDALVDGGLKICVVFIYYLCNRGYYKWTCMMNPMKHTSLRDERLWSEWVEPTRNDVVCCFKYWKDNLDS
jgi:hypothetical protein